mgnify:CR=1 FL=1
MNDSAATPDQVSAKDITARQQGAFSAWWASGAPWVWLNAGAVAISILLVAGLLMLIAVRGLGHFWPASVMETVYQPPGKERMVVLGQMTSREDVTSARLHSAGLPVDQDKETYGRSLIKVGNRDIGSADFVYVIDEWLGVPAYPDHALVIERREWGNLYGYLLNVKRAGNTVAEGENAWQAFQESLDRSNRLFDEIRDIEKHDIGAINYKMEQLRLDTRRLELDFERDGKDPALIRNTEEFAAIQAKRAELDKQYGELQTRLNKLYSDIGRDSYVVETAQGVTREFPFSKAVRGFRPNEMSLLDKSGFYLLKVWEFVSDEPREANTEGGIFPAIFGTVMMVILMSIFVTPFGVVAALYLREYAHQGWLTRTIRVAVNNLAGVPSIVYGVFGLGFFVYFLGGNIDQLFFPEALPSPTFGTPGMLWASLTLALLTLPVVIVATEEGLARIPRALREASLALGATKAETLWRVVLPMASPAMMTGLILAIARAAGEVAPLMLVGVVKLAPSLALDANAPFLHLDRKFMHLGFHIYDVGFQSPNVEAARPLVYATAFLLVLVIVALNLAAVRIRNHLREKYRSLEH